MSLFVLWRIYIDIVRSSAGGLENQDFEAQDISCKNLMVKDSFSRMMIRLHAWRNRRFVTLAPSSISELPCMKQVRLYYIGVEVVTRDIDGWSGNSQ